MIDAIDLSTVTILDAPDVRDWPATAAIEQIRVTPDNVRFTFTKQDGASAWPDQAFGKPEDHGTIEYTVWLFLEIDGKWYASGFIDMWRGRDGVGDSISDFAKNWYYDAGRWAPMTGHAILPGETIGFMLTAGDARNNASSSVHERSNVVAIVAPSGDMGTFNFGDAPAPPAPTPQPPAPPAVPTDLFELAQEIVSVGQAFIVAIEENTEELKALRTSGLKVHF